MPPAAAAAAAVARVAVACVQAVLAAARLVVPVQMQVVAANNSSRVDQRHTHEQSSDTKCMVNRPVHQRNGPNYYYCQYIPQSHNTRVYRVTAFW